MVIETVYHPEVDDTVGLDLVPNHTRVAIGAAAVVVTFIVAALATDIEVPVERGFLGHEKILPLPGVLVSSVYPFTHKKGTFMIFFRSMEILKMYN